MVVFDAVISMFYSVPGAVPIFITVSVAFGVKLGEHGADYTTTCKLKSLDSITNQTGSNLVRARDKDRCSRHALQQRPVGKPHDRRTVNDDEVKNLHADRQERMHARASEQIRGIGGQRARSNEGEVAKASVLDDFRW